MNQSETISNLVMSGWNLHATFPRWKVFSRRNAEETHHYFCGFLKMAGLQRGIIHLNK